MQVDEFRRLIQTHQSMVFSLALRIIGEHATAEEVAQDVFLELYAKKDLQSEDHIRFWLRRVAIHRATDALRRRSRRPEAAAEEWFEEQHSQSEASPNTAAVEARLEDLLHTLPYSLRVAIVLRYQEEMSPEEISLSLGQPVATIKSHLQRGLKLMRRKAAITMKEYIREQV